jgi:hypothetical protein
MAQLLAFFAKITASAALLIIIGGLVLSVPTYIGWNWLMPEVFPAISFWQSWGICVIGILTFCFFGQAGRTK